MPRRPPKTDPELQAHKEWLGYLQPRGLVVVPAAMGEAGWVRWRGPTGSEQIADLMGREARFLRRCLPW